MPKESQDADVLRRAYISDAAYYWYRAPDLDGDLVGVRRRLLAGYARRELMRRGISLPSDKEVYDYAHRIWRARELHPFKAKIGNLPSPGQAE